MVVSNDPLCIDTVYPGGRFGNQAVLFLVVFKVAKLLSMYLCLPDSMSLYFSEYPKILESFKNSSSVERKYKISSKLLDCGPFFQHYSLLKDLRDDAKFLFTPSNASISEANKYTLSQNDVVIHYRHFEGNPDLPYSFVPFGYFDSILLHHRKKGPGKIFVACEPHLVNENKIVSDLIKLHNATFLNISFHAQLLVARSSNTFIGTFGSLSFFLAYLTNASVVHLPFYSNLKGGSSWFSISDMFMYDNHRILYHDLSNDFLQNQNYTFHHGKRPKEVLAKSTPFSEAFIGRKKCYMSNEEGNYIWKNIAKNTKV